jgi:S1-C subfamily serine protease
MIKKLIKHIEKSLSPAVKIGIALVIGTTFAVLLHHPVDPKSATVMITNMRGNSGGTGIILTSKDGESKILTNAHVCSLVAKNGGVVITQDNRQHLVSTFITYSKHDLCLIAVQENLHASTEVSNIGPKVLEEVSVWGFPGLKPLSVSKGHVSDDRIIQVVVGFRECTKGELDSPKTGLFCIMVGGIPIIKTYQSTLVTALIEGGSSGSAVRNSSYSLVGVVFAGSGNGMSQAFTVPYNYVVDFLNGEAVTGLKEKPNYANDFSDADQERKQWDKKIKEFCTSNTDHEICHLLGASVELR